MTHAYFMSGMSEQALLAAVQQRLAAKYSWLPPEQVAAAVQSAHAQFIESTVREFVPLLVERRARAELSKASASNPGLAGTSVARFA